MEPPIPVDPKDFNTMLFSAILDVEAKISAVGSILAQIRSEQTGRSLDEVRSEFSDVFRTERIYLKAEYFKDYGTMDAPGGEGGGDPAE